MERLEQLVNEYCKRHDIQPKYTKRINGKITIESFNFDVIEAYYSASGRVVFKMDGKRESIYK